MKRVLKAIITAVCFVVVLPLILLANIVRKGFGSDSFFVAGSQIVSLLPGKIGSVCRVVYLRFTLEEFHLDSFILFGTFFPHWKTRVGRQAAFGEYAIVGESIIGDRVGISSKVSIIAGRYQHNFTDTTKGVFDTEPVFDCITIGDDVFIGEAAIVMANVGEWSIIGAGAVVVKDIPPYSIAVGNPARVIKQREPDGDWMPVTKKETS